MNAAPAFTSCAFMLMQSTHSTRPWRLRRGATRTAEVSGIGGMSAFHSKQTFSRCALSTQSGYAAMATGRLLPTQLQPLVSLLNVFDTEPKPYAFSSIKAASRLARVCWRSWHYSGRRGHRTWGIAGARNNLLETCCGGGRRGLGGNYDTLLVRVMVQPCIDRRLAELAEVFRRHDAGQPLELIAPKYRQQRSQRTNSTAENLPR
jgi:hypothetical protein